VSVNGSIGPYSLQCLSGRMQPLRPNVVLTSRGAKVGRPRAVPSYLSSVEAYASLAAAWSRARVYRSFIASWSPVVDGAGVVCEAALVCDVRCTITPAADGATLRTDWVLVAHPGWLQTGQAAVIDVASLPAIPKDQPQQALPGAGGSIGLLACEAISGDIQWPLSPGQVELMRKIGDNLKIEAIPQPSADDANVDAVICAANETEASRIQATLNSYIGNYVAVSVGGVYVGPCAVHGVTVDKRVSSDTTATGKPIACLVSMRCALEEPNSSDASSPSVAVLQYAKTWGTWIDIAGAVVWSASIGLGGSAGTAVAELDLGRTLRGGADASAKKVEEYQGRWCRIGVRVDLEGKPSRRGTERRWLWYGTIGSTEIASANNSSATMRISMTQLNAALDEVAPVFWLRQGRDPSGTPFTWAGDRPMPYNVQNYGDRNKTATDVDHEGQNVYVHNAAEAVPADRRSWTCGETIRNIVYHMNRQSGGPKWSIGGQVASLNHAPVADIGHESFVALLNAVASQRNGICWAQHVDDDGNPQILVRSISASPISIGGETIPATDRVADQVDTTKKSHVSCSIRRDVSIIRDRIYIEGGHPLFVGTWGFRNRDDELSVLRNERQFSKGWTQEEEDEWDEADEATKQGKLSHVWRRYVLGPKFNGFDWGPNAIIPFGRQKSQTGENGKYETTSEWDGGIARLPKVEDLRFARYLPWPRNDQPINKVDQFWGALKHGSGFAEPRAFVYVEDLVSPELDRDITSEYTIIVEENSPAVLIGTPEQANDIKSILNEDKAALFFTLALVHPLSWRVSWERPSDEMRRNWRRNVILKYPELNYWACLNKTIVQIGDDGEALGPDIDELYDEEMPAAFHVGFGGDGNAENVPRLQNLLTLARGLYETGNTGFSWTVRGIEFPSEDGYLLGDYVPSAKIQIDATRAIEQDIGAVISGISWEFAADNMLTHYECSRMIPGIDRLAIGAVAPGLHGGQDAAIIADAGAYQ
jgi:hypothetical protein